MGELTHIREIIPEVIEDMVKRQNSVEILYCIACSKDDKGKCCVIQDGECQNVIYAADEVNVEEMKLIGVSPDQSRCSWVGNSSILGVLKRQC